MNFNLLQKLIEESKLSKSTVAKRAQISRTTLDNALSGADIKISTIENLAKVLGVDSSIFFAEYADISVTQRGQQNNINGDNNIGQSADTSTLLAQIEEKDRQIARLLDIIQAMGK